MPIYMGVIRNEHGVFHARVKVPKRLQEAVAEVLRTGEPKRSWLKRSLDTKNKQEAKVRAAPILMDFNRILAEAEALLAERPLRTSLSAAEITRMGAYHYATMVSDHDIRLDQNGDPYRRLGSEVLRQHVRALRTIHASSQGEPVDIPPVPDVTAAVPARSDDTLRAAFAGWQKDRRPSPNSLEEYRRAVDLFAELHGELPVVSIKRSHARAFREALQDVPRRREKKLLKAPLPELAQWGREHPEDGPGVTRSGS